MRDAWKRNRVLLFTGCFFFFNDPATTEIYTLSLPDALPISPPKGDPDRPLHDRARARPRRDGHGLSRRRPQAPPPSSGEGRSEEHTSELQSRLHLACRLLLEKKNDTS